MPGISPFAIIVVLVLGVLFFGKNLPAVAKQIGSSLMEFRKGLDEWKEMRHSGTSVGKKKSGIAGAAMPEDEPMEHFETLGTKFEPPSSPEGG